MRTGPHTQVRKNRRLLCVRASGHDGVMKRSISPGLWAGIAVAAVIACGGNGASNGSALCGVNGADTLPQWRALQRHPRLRAVQQRPRLPGDGPALRRRALRGLRDERRLRRRVARVLGGSPVPRRVHLERDVPARGPHALRHTERRVHRLQGVRTARELAIRCATRTPIPASTAWRTPTAARRHRAASWAITRASSASRTATAAPRSRSAIRTTSRAAPAAATTRAAAARPRCATRRRACASRVFRTPIAPSQNRCATPIAASAPSA